MPQFGWGTLIFLLSGCSLLTPKAEPAVDLATLSGKPLTSEQTEQLLDTTGENWLYGQGLGETTVNAATSIAFPPYAVYLLGNGLLNLGGYEQLHITDSLPEGPRAMWNSAFDSVTALPGTAAASAAGRNFISRSEGEARIKAVVQPSGREHEVIDPSQVTTSSSESAGGPKIDNTFQFPERYIPYDLPKKVRSQ